MVVEGSPWHLGPAVAAEVDLFACRAKCPTSLPASSLDLSTNLHKSAHKLQCRTQLDLSRGPAASTAPFATVPPAPPASSDESAIFAALPRMDSAEYPAARTQIK